MKTLLFDIETTGLPPRGKKYDEHFNEFPHIVQIAWQLTNKSGNSIIKESRIIKPDGYEIPQEVIDIHGITNERAHEEGTDLKTVLRLFITDCMKVDTIVAHNIYFDTSITKANLLRLGIDGEIGNQALAKEKRVDTMMKTIKFVEARHPDGRKGKWPKLEELYFKLFGKGMPEAHDAGADVQYLKECYFELVKRKIL